MRFEYSGSPTKKSSTAVTQVDPRQAKKQARAMIMSHHWNETPLEASYIAKLAAVVGLNK